MEHRKPIASRSLASLRRIVLTTCMVCAAGLAACATPSASAQDVEIADEVELTFSSIDVEDRSRRLEVDYRLEDRDWRWARDQEYDLWLTLYAPEGDDYVFLHGMPLQSYRGRVLFPSHVRYYNYPYVGLCVVAVGVGDQLDPGYGYVCDNPIQVDVYGQRDVRWSDTRIIFSLGFHSGLYGYPWFHPYYGFYYPRSYYGPYPPIIIRDRHHYYPRRHYRRDHDYARKPDRHEADRHRPRHETRRHVDEPGVRRDMRDGRQPERVIRPRDRVVPPEQIAPRQRRIESRQPIQPRPEQVRPQQRQIRPQQVRPQQVRPQQIRPQQVRPQQVRPQQRQIRPQQVRPQQRQIRPQQVRPQQVRPQQRQIRPQQVRPQQVRPQQVRPQQRRIESR